MQNQKYWIANAWKYNFAVHVSWQRTEHRRSKALEEYCRWKAKQAAFCLAQHISLSFWVFIVMDWHDENEAGCGGWFSSEVHI